MVKGATGREAQGLLVGLVAFNVVPHALDAPPWILAVSAVFLVWKALHLSRGIPVPSRTFSNFLAGFSVLGVVAQYGTVIGQEAATALLLLLGSLKVLDSTKYRDSMLVIFISFFLLMTHLLASQSLPSTAFMAVDVFLITTLMFHLHKRDRRGSARSFRPVIRILGFAGPMMAFFFFAFPRFTLGLSPPAAGPGARTGFSDDLSPGDISRLVANDVPAFRATFRDGAPGKRPHPEDMYWRGAVLERSQGLKWAHDPSSKPRPPERTTARGPIAYEILLEPGYQKVLFTFEAARTVEFDDPGLQALVREGPGHVFSLVNEADGRLLYGATSALPAAGTPPSDAEFSSWLAPPPSAGRRVLALAARLSHGAKSEAEKSERLLAWFARENFRYTRTPPALRSNSLEDFLFETRQGFCEHYAGAYASMMRLMGAPARVVIGFQGGKLNEFGSYFLVRGLDAHAWAEVYRRDLRRWWRVDPTNAVAPLRTLLGGGFDSSEAGGMAARLGWLSRGLARTGMAWDAATTAWSGFLLRYDFDYQMQLLGQIGVSGASRLVFVLWLIFGAALFASALYGFLRWQSKREEPLLKAWRSFCRRLERAGIGRALNEGPTAFAERALSGHGQEQARTLALEFSAVRYGLGLEGRRGEREHRLLRALRRYRVPR